RSSISRKLAATWCCRRATSPCAWWCAWRRRAGRRWSSRSAGPMRWGVPRRMLEARDRAPHPVAMDTNAADGVGPGCQWLHRPHVFTPAAAAKVRELIAEEGIPALKLRVYIQGGGCSGFQYGFEFDEQQGEDDLAIDTDGVTMVVDPLSLQYLMGATVDYAESLHGAQFTIRNPNARSTCGCGSSFVV